MRLAAMISLLAQISLIGTTGCGDPGPRDRSLRLQIGKALGGSPRTGDTGKRHSASMGLVADPLAPFYAEGAPIVVRFDTINSLVREAAPRLTEISRALPVLRLPTGTPASLLRKLLRLPSTTVFDPLRPLALVRTVDGWAAIVPTRARKEAGDRLRALDGIYCVAGDPAVVKKYTPGFRKGYHLPGDWSIVAKPGAMATLGTELTSALGGLQMDLRFLDGRIGTLPQDIERVDLALRFAQGGLRCDIRLKPRRDSATAMFLERMKPRSTSVAAWLPSGGTAYVEFGTSAVEWERLLLNLFRDTVRMPDVDEAPGLYAVRTGLAALGDDFAAMLDLDPDGAGHVALIGEVKETDEARAYLGSPDFTSLLKYVAGPGGHLELKQGAFHRDGIHVAAVTGHLSDKRLSEWREGNVIESTLSVLARGPVVAYIAIANGKLCVVTGARARAQMERLLDAVLETKPEGNWHSAAVDRLFRSRLASASVDLAALFDGCREAAPLWHEHGRSLRDIALGWRLPAAAAITVEGGAFCVGLRFPPHMLADAAAKVRDTLEKK